MPKLHLIGAANHRTGTHRIHSPRLDSETGRPLAGKGDGNSVVTTTFHDGVADLDDAGLVRYLVENKHASLEPVAAYGLRQPGVGPVVEHDEAGNAVEVVPAQPAADKPAEAAKAAAKKEG